MPRLFKQSVWLKPLNRQVLRTGSWEYVAHNTYPSAAAGYWRRHALQGAEQTVGRSARTHVGRTAMVGWWGLTQRLRGIFGQQFWGGGQSTYVPRSGKITKPNSQVLSTHILPKIFRIVDDWGSEKATESYTASHTSIGGCGIRVWLQYGFPAGTDQILARRLPAALAWTRGLPLAIQSLYHRNSGVSGG